MRKKKDKILIALFVCAAVLLGLGCFFRSRTSIGVIGGADGPTAIFVAGKVGTGDLFFTAAAILAGAAFGYYLTSKRRKR